MYKDSNYKRYFIEKREKHEYEKNLHDHFGTDSDWN